MVSFKQFFLENTIDPETPYVVIDKQTGEIVWRGPYSKRNIARKVVDRRDNKYGGYRFLARIAKENEILKEYRHNLDDGTPKPSIQVHNGKDPNRMGPDKKHLGYVPEYQAVNPKVNVIGATFFGPELARLMSDYNFTDYTSGKVHKIKNSPHAVELFEDEEGKPAGRIIKVNRKPLKRKSRQLKPTTVKY